MIFAAAVHIDKRLLLKWGSHLRRWNDITCKVRLFLPNSSHPDKSFSLKSLLISTFDASRIWGKLYFSLVLVNQENTIILVIIISMLAYNHKISSLTILTQEKHTAIVNKYHWTHINPYLFTLSFFKVGISQKKYKITKLRIYSVYMNFTHSQILQIPFVIFPTGKRIISNAWEVVAISFTDL